MRRLALLLALLAFTLLGQSGGVSLTSGGHNDNACGNRSSSVCRQILEGPGLDLSQAWNDAFWALVYPNGTLTTEKDVYFAAPPPGVYQLVQEKVWLCPDSTPTEGDGTSDCSGTGSTGFPQLNFIGDWAHVRMILSWAGRTEAVYPNRFAFHIGHARGDGMGDPTNYLKVTTETPMAFFVTDDPDVGGIATQGAGFACDGCRGRFDAIVGEEADVSPYPGGDQFLFAMSGGVTHITAIESPTGALMNTQIALGGYADEPTEFVLTGPSRPFMCGSGAGDQYCAGDKQYVVRFTSSVMDDGIAQWFRSKSEINLKMVGTWSYDAPSFTGTADPQIISWIVKDWADLDVTLWGENDTYIQPDSDDYTGVGKPIPTIRLTGTILTHATSVPDPADEAVIKFSDQLVDGGTEFPNIVLGPLHTNLPRLVSQNVCGGTIPYSAEGCGGKVYGIGVHETDWKVDGVTTSPTGLCVNIDGSGVGACTSDTTRLYTATDGEIMYHEIWTVKTVGGGIGCDVALFIDGVKTDNTSGNDYKLRWGVSGAAVPSDARKRWNVFDDFLKGSYLQMKITDPGAGECSSMDGFRAVVGIWQNDG